MSGKRHPITGQWADIEVSLPFPPSLNHLYATVRGRRVLSAGGRQYKRHVALLALQHGITPCVGEVWVELRFFRPRRIGDLDNMLKATIDSLNGICWKDDSQIQGISATRFDDKANPRVDIRVKDYAERGKT